MCVAIVGGGSEEWWCEGVDGGGCGCVVMGVTERRVGGSRNGGGRWRHQLMPPVDAS